MRPILVLLAGAAILALPAAAAARPQAHHAAPGFLVVRDASTDNGITGRPVATLVVHGFVLGRVAQEGAVQLYHLRGLLPAQVDGIDVSRRAVTFRRVVQGTEYSGSGFRFRAVGGFWRVVVYGAGVSLYAGGTGRAYLHGSVEYPRGDGDYSVNGGTFVSLPSGVVKRRFGAK